MSHPPILARLYGPGGPADGMEASLAWRGQWLVVSGGEAVLHTLAIADLRAEARGFNDSQLGLYWSDAAGDHVLILDASALAVFREAAPAAFGHRLEAVRQAQRRTDRRFRWGIAVLLTTLSLPLVALGLFLGFSDPLADWVVKRIPPSVEARLGEGVLAQTRAQSSLVASGPVFDGVQAIAQRLARPDEKLRFYVADRPEINAFAAPGGVVVVNTGLLRAAGSPEEVAGVLAHEIAHVELRHSLGQLVKAAGLRVLLSAGVGDYGPLTDWGARLTELKFSRDAERVADTRGLERLVAARIDPAGLPRFFKTLEKSEAGGTPPALLSTHPATGERQASLGAAIQALGTPAVEPIPVDWPALQAALPRPR